MVKIGDKISFIPAGFLDLEGGRNGWADSPQIEIIKRVTGEIVYINKQNRFCRVEYDCAGTKQHQCFKLDDNGDIHVPPTRMDRLSSIPPEEANRHKAHHYK